MIMKDNEDRFSDEDDADKNIGDGVKDLGSDSDDGHSSHLSSDASS